MPHRGVSHTLVTSSARSVAARRRAAGLTLRNLSTVSPAHPSSLHPHVKRSGNNRRSSIKLQLAVNWPPCRGGVNAGPDCTRYTHNLLHCGPGQIRADPCFASALHPHHCISSISPSRIFASVLESYIMPPSPRTFAVPTSSSQPRHAAQTSVSDASYYNHVFHPYIP